MATAAEKVAAFLSERDENLAVGIALDVERLSYTLLNVIEGLE
jgi:hypothetical protein